MAVTPKISFDEMAANPQPIMTACNGRRRSFGSLQLDDDQAALARHTEQINHAALARRKRRYLRIKIPRMLHSFMEGAEKIHIARAQ